MRDTLVRKLRSRILATRQAMFPYIKRRRLHNLSTWAGALCEISMLLAAVAVAGSSAAGQSTPQAASARRLPEPIQWKQNRFLIPYQWSHSSDPAAARAVWLFISKDAGNSWQKISEAEPNLRGFTYHAEQDGEYWFSIRTVDQNGRLWPAGPHEPELRVIVDTTFPQIVELTGVARADGQLEIHWKAVDAHINPEGLRVQAKSDLSEDWQHVPVPRLQMDASGATSGKATWPIPPGAQAISMRAELYDLAGNRSFRGAEVAVGDRGAFPAPVSDPAAGGISAAPHAFASNNWAAAPQGTVNTTANSPAARGWQASPATPSSPVPAASSQPWPADATSSLPSQYPLDDDQSAGRNGATVYRMPDASDEFASIGSDSVAWQPSTAGEHQSFRQADRPDTAQSSSPHQISPPTNPNAPFHSASFGARTLPDRSPDDTTSAYPGPAAGSDGNLPAGVQPMVVASRTFDLEYELESVGRWGVSRVELWGTRDGGKSWRSYSVDDDNRSPLRVMVEGEGMYGFRIVVQSAGGQPATGPRPGDLPEMWVQVDLRRPQAELLSVQQGAGNLSEYLILRWRANDTNLDARPIALFYSSRSGGPWSAIATGLENSGEYAWRLERHLPSQFYVRLEARDTAGNLAAYQTPEPIQLPSQQPKGHLRGVRSTRDSADSIPR